MMALARNTPALPPASPPPLPPAPPRFVFVYSRELRNAPSLLVTSQNKAAAALCKSPHSSIDEEAFDEIAKDFIAWRQALGNGLGGK